MTKTQFKNIVRNQVMHSLESMNINILNQYDISECLIKDKFQYSGIVVMEEWLAMFYATAVLIKSDDWDHMGDDIINDIDTFIVRVYQQVAEERV